MAAYRDAASKGLEVRGTTSMPIGTAGRVVPISAVSKVPVSALTKALRVGKVLAGGWGMLGAFTGGVAVGLWMKDAKLFVGDDGNLEKREMSTPSTCTVCVEYTTRMTGSYNPNEAGWRPTQSAACTAAAAQIVLSPNGVTSAYGIHEGDSCTVHQVMWYGTDSPLLPPWPFMTRELVPDTGHEVVTKMTDSQAMDELEKFQPSPDVLKDLYTIDKSGRYTDKMLKDLASRNLVTSGPATVEGPETIKETPAQNGQPAKTVTEKTNYNCVFVMADVTCNEKKTTTDTSTGTDPNTGQPVTTQTISTEQKEAEKPKEDAVDPCIEHPKRNGCREDEFDTPDGEIPKTTKTITYIAESLGFGAGSCPANVTQTMHGMTTPITLVNWADNCDKITTYAKPMILAMATFAALMIIFAGGRPE